MKKLILFLCLSPSLSYAMNQNLPTTNTSISVNINSPSLGDTIVNTLGKSGVIVVKTNNPPENDLFTVLREIDDARRKERQYQRIKNSAIVTGLLAVFAILKNING